MVNDIKSGSTTSINLVADFQVKSTYLVSPLVKNLCEKLRRNEINYCHWKSNNLIDRSASGVNDLDLLVGREDVGRFLAILNGLGFKEAKAPRIKQLPGVQDFFGYDEKVDKIIHVHAHYQLIIGHDMTKNVRVPIEKEYLASSVRDDLFNIPSPEYEYLVFIIRMVLKHSTWDTILGLQGSLNTAERDELAFLKDRVDQALLDQILNQQMPYLGTELFNDCIATLEQATLWQRIKIGHQLQTRLLPYSRRILPLDTFLKLWREANTKILRRFFRITKKYQLENGGLMIAIVGGDGAGKSTSVSALTSWASKYFRTTKIHLGKPKWTIMTMVVRGVLKVGKSLGLYSWELDSNMEGKKFPIPAKYPWLLREVCRARDRYRTYRKAQRFAVNGGIVILDRFPLPEIEIMDGPLAESYLNRDETSRVAKRLIEIEKSYYDRFALPELIVVLRLNPEIAVQRKTDEDAESVRRRSTAIWETDWDNSAAIVIDSSKSKAEVQKELKRLIWSRL